MKRTIIVCDHADCKESLFKNGAFTDEEIAKKDWKVEGQNYYCPECGRKNTSAETAQAQKDGFPLFEKKVWHIVEVGKLTSATCFKCKSIKPFYGSDRVVAPAGWKREPIWGGTGTFDYYCEICKEKF